MAGYRYAPSGTDVAPDVVELARLGKTNDAIKLYRQQTDAYFQQATEVVEQIAAGRTGMTGLWPDRG